jgi:2-phosphosulfolactate phosphatase
MRRVGIGVGPPSPRRFGIDDAAVVVDVIRSMTTAVSAAALGARCLPVASPREALALARVLEQPLLAGEVGGKRPPGFDLSNSPAKLVRRADLHERPVVLLSSSGTPLLMEVRRAGAVYPACLRNRRALAEHLARRHRRVTVLGAATRGQFREEDQLLCAFIAGALVDAGFAIEDEATAVLIARWSSAPVEALLVSKSVEYLRRSGQLDDLDFILTHVDDLDEVFRLHAGEILPAAAVKWAAAI